MKKEEKYKKIKAWIHWDWDNNEPYPDDNNDGDTSIWFNKEMGVEHGAKEVEIFISE